MEYIIGGDIGKINDNATIAVLKHKPEYRDQEARKGTRRHDESPTIMMHHYQLVHLEKVPLGTTYPALARRLMTVSEHKDLLGVSDLVIDVGGVGEAVNDLIVEAGGSPIPVTLTAGLAPTYNEERGMWSLPKKNLVAELIKVYHTGRITMNPRLPYLADLQDQLKGFSMKLKKDTAHASYEAMKDEVHDDLVIALGLCTWWAGVTHGGLDEVMSKKKRENYSPKSFRPS